MLTKGTDMERMAIRSFKLELRELGASAGEFTGYASVFKVRNEYYDEVIEPGAFKQTLKHNGGKVPILADHMDWIGFGQEAHEDSYGLAVHGKLAVDDVALARERWALMQMSADAGRPAGMSIGFYPKQWRDERKDDQLTRHITEIQLLEYSITPFPSLEEAMVQDMRSAADMLYRRRIITAEQYEQALAAAGATPDAVADRAGLHLISEALTELRQQFT